MNIIQRIVGFVTIFISCLFAANSADKPNAILICNEGYQDLGCYVSSNIKIPRITQHPEIAARLAKVLEEHLARIQKYL